MNTRLAVGLTAIIVAAGCETLPPNLLNAANTKPAAQSTYIEERRELVCKSTNVYPKQIVTIVSKVSKSSSAISIENYELIGNIWGQYMSQIAQESANVNNDHNELFSCFLYGESFGRGLSFDYFGIHRDMKKSFQAGFREGYGERNSDLVMGVNLNEAARLKAKDSAVRLMDVYREKIIADVLATSRFKRDWASIMDETLRTFEEITAEGSPAESRAFLSSFPKQYEQELSVLTSCLKRSTICDLRPDARKRAAAVSVDDINSMLKQGFIPGTDESKVLGTVMNYEVMTVEIDDKERPENTYFKYIKKEKKNRGEALKISDSSVQNRILRGDGLVEQVNKISWLFVGQEMGRKFNHNLISRRELIEWIKRARSIMESKSGDNYYSTSIRLLREGFQSDSGYGAGGETEWERLREETNLDI